MLCADHLKLVLVCLLLPSGGVGENGFNCEDECGMYTKNDRVAPLLHESCTAMTESEKCKRKFEDIEKRKRSRKKRKKDDTRIVGGEPANDAMPWMVTAVFFFFKYRCFFQPLPLPCTDIFQLLKLDYAHWCLPSPLTFTVTLHMKFGLAWGNNL